MAFVQHQSLMHLTGTSILTTNTSVVFPCQRAARGIRVYCQLTATGASPISSFTIRLQGRYDDGSLQIGPIDIKCTNLTPGTFALDQVITVIPGSPATSIVLIPQDTFLDNLIVNVKANAVGIAGDVVDVRILYGA